MAPANGVPPTHQPTHRMHSALTIESGTYGFAFTTATTTTTAKTAERNFNHFLLDECVSPVDS